MSNPLPTFCKPTNTFTGSPSWTLKKILLLVTGALSRVIHICSWLSLGSLKAKKPQKLKDHYLDPVLSRGQTGHLGGPAGAPAKLSS